MCGIFYIGISIDVLINDLLYGLVIFMIALVIVTWRNVTGVRNVLPPRTTDP